MHMFYWWDTYLQDFFFEGYTITSGWGLFATCLMLFALAIFFEFIKVLQARHRQRELKRIQQTLRTICTNENASLITNSAEVRQPMDNIPPPFNKFYLFGHELFLWLFQECLGYALMLAVMFYNGYMTIAVAFGAGLGYFMFGQTLIKINKENCTVKKESLCYTNCRDNDNSGLIPNAENRQETYASDAIGPDEPCSSHTEVTVYTA